MLNTQGNSNKTLSKLLSIALPLLGAAPAYSEASGSIEKLEEVIVRGEKVARSVQDTVSSVGVLTASDIEESSLYDIQQAYSRLANVTSAFNERGFTIRGINYNSVSGGGNGGLASFHIDGAVMSRRALALGQGNLWDMQQIEVFRGPQSTNQGRNSLAGAVFFAQQRSTVFARWSVQSVVRQLRYACSVSGLW